MVSRSDRGRRGARSGDPPCLSSTYSRGIDAQDLANGVRFRYHRTNEYGNLKVVRIYWIEWSGFIGLSGQDLLEFVVKLVGIRT